MQRCAKTGKWCMPMSTHMCVQVMQAEARIVQIKNKLSNPLLQTTHSYRLKGSHFDHFTGHILGQQRRPSATPSATPVSCAPHLIGWLSTDATCTCVCDLGGMALVSIWLLEAKWKHSYSMDQYGYCIMLRQITVEVTPTWLRECFPAWNSVRQHAEKVTPTIFHNGTPMICWYMIETAYLAKLSTTIWPQFAP